MPPVRHLRRAPLTEAVIDFRIDPLPTVTQDLFRVLTERLRENYPQIEEQTRFVARLEFKGGDVLPPAGEVLGFYGYLCKSADGLSIAQFRVDGFTFNRLKPYTSWRELLPEAMRLWRLYSETVQVADLTRLGLRYINHLSIPSGSDLSHYFIAPLSIPQSLPQEVHEFLTRVVIYDSGRTLLAAVTQALEAALGEQLSVLFDIDVFREVRLKPASGEIETVLELLHDFKNEIFFESVTETMLRRYE